MTSWQRQQERVDGERQRIVGARRFWAGKEDAGKEEANVWASIYCTIRERRRCKSHSSLPRAASWGSRTPSTVSSEDAVSDGPTPSTASSVSTQGGTTPTAATTTTTTTTTATRKQGAATARRPSRSKSMDVLPPRQEEPVVAHVEVASARRYLTTCYLAMKPVPVRFSSSVRVRLGSTRKTFTEQVHFKTRLVPLRFSETLCLPPPPPRSFPNLRPRNGQADARERFV